MLHRLGWIPPIFPSSAYPAYSGSARVWLTPQGWGEPILWSEEADFISVQSILGVDAGELSNPADRFPLPELLSGWAAPRELQGAS